MITGLGTLAASVLAGQLWDHVSPAAPFLLGAVSAVLALMLLLAAMPARTTARAR
jgi:predicted MFS family arabinose efflux permease